MRHVIFQLGRERYALPLSAVREVVVPAAAYSRVPRAPPAVCGVMNLRGRVVTVVALERLLGLGKNGASGQRVILLDRGRRDLGLLVGEVSGIESLEKVVRAPGRESAAVRGVSRLKGLVVTVLDAEGLDGMVTGLFQSKGRSTTK